MSPGPRCLCCESQHLAEAPPVAIVPHLNPETSRGHTSAVLVAGVLQGSACRQF